MLMVTLSEPQETRRAALATAIERFIAMLEAQPPALFLHARAGRTPRDIVAHLIGWNRSAVAARPVLAHGELPECLVEPGPDFVNTNARAMATYDSRDKAILLAQLRDSAAAWDAMLRALPAVEWDETNGVRLGQWPVSNGALVEALTEDYEHHREELSQWST
jgi:hypothetical protein